MKLYPPQIEGTLPSFYKSKTSNMVLTIPFAMNKAVSMAEVGGFSLKVKSVIEGEELFTKQVFDVSSTTEVSFRDFSVVDLLKLKIGSYYKVQLAYIDKPATSDTESTVGYYSTVGVIKCTGQPEINIQGLDTENSNIHRYSYTGYYSNTADPTEKAYTYRFILSDVQGNIIKDSGEILHKIEDNSSVNSYESTDTYEFPFDLEEDKVFFVQYIVTTNNNLIVKSPRYRVVQTNSGPIEEPITIEAIPNFEEGCVNLLIYSNESDDVVYELDMLKEYDETLAYYEQIYEYTKVMPEDYEPNKYYVENPFSSYLLITDEEFDKSLNYYKKTIGDKYVPITLTKDTYQPYKYYVQKRVRYVLSSGTDFDTFERYYTKKYRKAKVRENNYQKYTYYLKRESYARGNFLITRSCKDTGYKEWNKIAEIKIEGYKQNFYDKNDYTVEQGKYYKYSIQQYNNYQVFSERLETEEIFVDFEDIFLYDGEKQLKIRYNPKVSSFKNNILETKIDTIGGKYPFIFRNGQVSYKEFPISGLISYEMDNNYNFVSREELGFSSKYPSLKRKGTLSPIENIKAKYQKNLLRKNTLINILEGYDSEGNPNKRYYTRKKIAEFEAELAALESETENIQSIYREHKRQEIVIDDMPHEMTNLEGVNFAAERYFKMKVLDWLNDGKPKLFRSPGEGNYLIRLMNVSLSPEDNLGRMLHSFSATAYEIADCDYNNLRYYDIIAPDTINYNFMLWKTILLSQSKMITISDDGTPYQNEKGEAKSVYAGEVEYISDKDILEGRKAYVIKIQNMQPGTKITLTDDSAVSSEFQTQDIYIGATGAYYAESEKGFSSLRIPVNDYYQGSITFNYYGLTRDRFDLITNEFISQVGIKQFVGPNPDIIESVQNDIYKIKDFGYIQLMKKDIYEVEVYNAIDWEKTYYTEQTTITGEKVRMPVYFNRPDFWDDQEKLKELSENGDTYYFQNPYATGIYLDTLRKGERFIPGFIYYINNSKGINPIYITDLDEENFEYEIKEKFFTQSSFYKDATTDLIQNPIALYQYETENILINNEIISLEESIEVFRDLYNDKYYISEEDYNKMLEEENPNVQYFEILSFDAYINDENINVLFKDFKFKDKTMYDKISIGNGVILNCSYQARNLDYAFTSSILNIEDIYKDDELNSYKVKLDEYDKIIKGESASEDVSALSLDNIDDIIQYYKSQMTDSILDIVDAGEKSSAELINEYSDFLKVYKEYLEGKDESSTLEDLKQTSPKMYEAIQPLISEIIIIQEDAMEKYSYYYNLYINRLNVLLQKYEEDSDVNKYEQESDI